MVVRRLAPKQVRGIQVSSASAQWPGWGPRAPGYVPQQVEPVARLHGHQPAAPVALVDHDGHLVACVVNRLGHGLVDVEPLGSFDLEVEPRQVGADDIRAVRRAGELLAAPGLVAMSA